MDNEVTHLSQQLWDHYDQQITQNNLSISSYCKCYENHSDSLSLQLNIVNKKSKVRMNFSINHQHATLFLARFKPIYDDMKELKTLVESGGSKSFQIDDFRKLVVTFLNRAEYGGLCVRVAVGEKQNDLQNSEIEFLPLTSFLSFIKIFTDYRDSYLQLNQSMMSVLLLNNMNKRIDMINNKMTNYFATYQSTNNSIRYIPEPTRQKEEEEVFIDIESSSSSNDQNDDISVENPPEQKEEIKIELPSSPTTADDEIHSDLNDFIDKERDSFVLSINESKKPLPDRSEASILKNKFVEEFLENDITNLEMYLLNCVNDLNPVAKFFDVLNKKTSINYYDAEEQQKVAIQYSMASYIRYMMKRHLEEKIELPQSVPTVRYDHIKTNSDDLELMYDMYLFMIYFSQLRTRLREKDRNTTNNRELTCFLLKSILSPVLFTHIKNINIDVFTSGILTRFHKYENSKVFVNLEKQIKDHYQILPSITSEAIKSEVHRTYSVITQNYDKITIENMFMNCKANKMISFDYDVFKSYKLKQEQILKILILDTNLQKNKKVNLDEIKSTTGIKDFTDIPEGLISFFGISGKKSDTSNLIRFVKEKFKDDPNLKDYLKLCNNIDDSFYSLINKDIDFSQYPELLLKAVYLWDNVNDSKISNNYMYYVEKINSCSLDSSMLMSLLNNLEERKDSDFVKSLLATNEIGA